MDTQNTTITWQDFKEAIREEAPTSSRFRVNKDDGTARLLFRGQANSDWGLKTTLERAGHPVMLLSRYMQNCNSARRFLGNLVSCDIPFDPHISWSDDDAHRGFPNYEYAGYLRHHGFPSPLLDWTESPFVAAFFAFRNIQEGVSKVRIYGYQSQAGHGRGSEGGVARLEVLGPFASIHERHIAQQCWYTWCCKEDNKDHLLICPHEEGFQVSADRQYRNQDIITAWDISASERPAVLADLFQMNITPYSLFRTIDSAAETASLRIL
jgi:hypothetical protein